MPLLLLAAPVQTETGFGTFVHFSEAGRDHKELAELEPAKRSRP